MRIVWVSFAPLRKHATGFSSDVASVRYRLTIPAQAVAGSKVTYVGAGANRRTLLERFERADAAVFGKIFDASFAQVALELMAALRKRGVRLIADYSDDNFAHPTLGPAYRALANAVDVLVASTPGLADVLREQSPLRVTVVTDPVEGRRGEPRASAQHPPRLLWFGHPVNLETLRLGLDQLAARRIPFGLSIMTAPGIGAEALGHRFRAWSTEALFDELAECDAVIIPSNPHDPRKAVKSPNRFNEALWAGRFVIAHPLPAYEPLGAYGWVGDDIGDGLAWLLGNPQPALERIRAGQQAVAEHYSPEAVGRAWLAAIAAA